MKFVKTTPKSIVNIWNSKAQTIILNTNAEGKMHGIAKGLMNYDLEAASEYMRLCARSEVLVGTPVHIRSNKHRGQQYILCPIKHRSGDAPKASALESCLRTIRANAGIWDITSIATHPMGCGSSDVYLSWEQVVYPMYQYYMGDAPIPVTVYGASDPTPAPVVVEDEPATSVVPVVKPAPVVEDTEVVMDEWIIFHYTSNEWILDYMFGRESKHDPRYVPAGQVTITSGERDQVLEALFELSQNVEGKWHDLDCVIPGRSSRSTCVGDVFMFMGNRACYRVDGNEFILIKTPVFV